MAGAAITGTDGDVQEVHQIKIGPSLDSSIVTYKQSLAFQSNPPSPVSKSLINNLLLAADDTVADDTVADDTVADDSGDAAEDDSGDDAAEDDGSFAMSHGLTLMAALPVIARMF